MPNFSGLWSSTQQFQALGANTWPSLPGAPTIGTASVASGTSASVAFTAPGNTGYPAGITGYTVTSSPEGLTGTGASSPITVTGLTTGTAYTFTVKATNATGTGPSSAASNSITPPFTYVEDVFSTFTYTGDGATKPIVNDVALSSTAAWSTYSLTHSSQGITVSDTVTDSSGNIYLVGGRGNGTGSIVKYNSSFAIQWHKEITPTPSSCVMESVAVDSSGNVFVAGRIGDGPSDEGQLVVFKLDSSGTIQWQFKLGTDRTAYVGGISVDSSGNIRVSGYVQQPTSTRSMLLKIASNGTLTWQRFSSNTGAESRGKHAVDSSGNTYMGVFTYGGDYHSFGVLQKWDTDGTLTWQRMIDITGWGGGLDGGVVMDSAGSIYAAGSWNVTGTSSATLAKYNSSGTLQWRRYYYISASFESGGGNQGIATDGTYVYLKAYINSAYSGYTYPTTLFKISNTGTTVWKRGLFHSGTTNFNTGPLGNSLAVSPDGATLYASGTIYNTVPNYQSDVVAIPTASDASGKALYNITTGGFHIDAVFSAGTESAASITTGTSTYTTSTPSYSFANASNYTVTAYNQSPVTGFGGLTWLKGRSGAYDHGLFDTIRGADYRLTTSSTAASSTPATPWVTAFDANGFTVGTNAAANNSGTTYASWTFRKQPKFFDVVTYTGNGVSRMIDHNLGSIPGMIIYKNTSSINNWWVYHRSLGATTGVCLNRGDLAADTSNDYFGNQLATTTQFPVGANDLTNGTGTYVAYIFAHDAGGFGSSGADNVISCGLLTMPSSGDVTVTLGYEPQFLMFKGASNASDAYMVDTMRGLTQTSQARIDANTSSAEEITASPWFKVTSTGFTASAASIGSSRTFIYMAIRKGPMKTPTDATKVFLPLVYTGNGGTKNLTSGFPVDFMINRVPAGVNANYTTMDRLRGFGTASDSTKYLFTNNTDAEGSASNGVTDMGNNGITLGSWGQINTNTTSYINWMFRRAPGFFDEVCYTGTGSNTTQAHNLGVAPELIIIKARSFGQVWVVGTTAIGFGNYLLLNTTDATASGSNVFNSTAPTSTVFSLGTGTGGNQSTSTYVAYLFATCAGVSKVGSYTGTGTTLNIDCGFTAGARFVLIKRTDSTGNWFVWDTARGIISGNDPYLILNDREPAEVTNTDYIDPYSPGFTLSSTAPVALNASGGTYIFLAIA